jgi:MFS family permease
LTSSDEVFSVEKDPLYGWIMVFIVFTLSGLAFGAFGSISVFLKPLAAEFGWTRGQASFGYTVATFSSAVFGVVWGYVADRIGTRWFGVAGTLAMIACMFLLSNQASIVQFYLFYFLFGAFGQAIVSGPLFANVGFWFQHNPGLAMGVMLSGSAVGQGVVPYLLGLVITSSGWESAYVTMAWIYFIVALPIAFLVRESPARQRAMSAPGNDVRSFPLSQVEVVAWISIAVIFCCNCMAVPIVHLVPLLTDQGHSLTFAAETLLLLMSAGAIGRIAGGKLVDVLGPLPAYMTMSLGQTVSVYWFPHIEQVSALYLLAVIFGFTYSGVMASFVVCTRLLVSARFIGTALGITAFFGWTGMGVGGFVGGLLFDINGDYFESYAFASLMGVINLVILVMFYVRIEYRRRLQPVLED